MCSIAAVGIGLSIVQGIAGFIGERKAAKAQDRSIAESDQLQAQGLSNQRQEVKETTANDIANSRREAMILRGRIRVEQGESGGNSAARLLRDAGFQEALQVAGFETNAKRQLRQNTLEDRGRQATTRSRYANVKRPSLVGTGLQIAGSAMGYMPTSAFSTAKTTAPTPPWT